MEKDFTVHGGGTVYLLQPNTPAARTWVEEHIPEDAMKLGDNVAIEHRFVGDVLSGIIGDGLTVSI